MDASVRDEDMEAGLTVGTITVVLMGVAGAGKTTVMELLAADLGWSCAEGDSFHPPANVRKMAAGHPLTDEDRWPWLEAVAHWIGAREAAGEDAIVTCSALRRDYRDLLRRGHPSVWFVDLVAPRDVLESRLEHRRGHYMPLSLLPSQLADLEPLGPDEPGETVSAEPPAAEVAARILGDLAGRRDQGSGEERPPVQRARAPEGTGS